MTWQQVLEKFDHVVELAATNEIFFIFKLKIRECIWIKWETCVQSLGQEGGSIPSSSLPWGSIPMERRMATHLPENSMDTGAWQATVHEFTVHPSGKWYYPRLPCLWMLTACVEVGTQTPPTTLLSPLWLISTCHPNIPPFSSCCHRPAWLTISHLANPHSLQAGFHAQIHPPQDFCCNASRWTSF